MKILFTSVGRRVELIQMFREAAERLGIKIQILGADMTESAPALCFCNDTVVVPRINDEQYVPKLVEVCEKEHIQLLVPTIDTDLLILAEHKSEFEEVGTTVLVSAPENIIICRDKRKTFRFFEGIGLAAPKTVDHYDSYSEGFPAFIKPKDGSSSILAYKVSTKEELEEYSKRVPDYIVQPFIEGVEYTVDAFCDFNGNPIYITPRIRLAVRAGEVLKTEISQDARIIKETKEILDKLKPCGPITIQLIRENRTGVDYFIEINPRFGGGAPLSMKAGADSAEKLLQLLQGKQVEFIPGAAEDGAIYSRFDQSVRVKN